MSLTKLYLEHFTRAKYFSRGNESQIFWMRCHLVGGMQRVNSMIFITKICRNEKKRDNHLVEVRCFS